MSENKRAGSLVCVGIGMTLGSHIGPLARSYIEQADVVFAAVSDGIVEQWVEGMHADVRSLQDLYAEGTSRMQTYHGMVDTLLGELRKGRKVCGVFYGHPGVFAWPAHRAIELARSEGFEAHMEPGISAEDCLYADLGIDPGKFGCQHFEATQLIMYQRRIDPTAYLVLWQAGVVGDRTLTRFSTGPEYRKVLVDVLSEDYPDDHPVIIYRAVTLPIDSPRIRKVPLNTLAEAEIDMQDTLILPPARSLQPNRDVVTYLDELDLRHTESRLSGPKPVPQG